MIKLSVIIPTFNRRRVLERTLPSLLTQDIPPDEYEIIVVIDGSTDGTADMLRGLRPKCACAYSSPCTVAQPAAGNMALQTAVGELVLFLDDDLLCSPGLLQKALRFTFGLVAFAWFTARFTSLQTAQTRSSVIYLSGSTGLTIGDVSADLRLEPIFDDIASFDGLVIACE